MTDHKAVRLFDFDRTLFDTARFVDWLWGYMATTYGVDGEAEKRRASQFYHYDGDWYDYQFFDHVEAIASMTDNVEVFVEKCQAAASDDFLFADADSVLADIDGILTFGNEPYQRFKLSFVPKLAAIPTTIVQSDKGSYITRTYDDHPVTLIDDKRLEATLPRSVRFIHLDRSQAEPLVRHDEYVSINTLELFRSALALY